MYQVDLWYTESIISYCIVSYCTQPYCILHQCTQLYFEYTLKALSLPQRAFRSFFPFLTGNLQFRMSGQRSYNTPTYPWSKFPLECVPRFPNLPRKVNHHEKS